MQTLSPQHTEQASGGIAWTTPALVALADSASFGPLVASFGAGWALGSYIYANFISE